MAAPVIKGFVEFIATNLGLAIWDGEIPRQGVDGVNITPDAPIPDWPAVHCMMPEEGLSRDPTFTDGYGDMGTMTIQVWALTRAQAEQIGGQVEALLAPEANWRAIFASMPPFECFMLLLDRWTCIQEPDKRTQQGELLYRYDLHYQTGIHGEWASLTLLRFAFNAPSTALSGQGFAYTVTAFDRGNETFTGYVGSVTFTSSDTTAVLHVPSKLTSGKGTFSATLNTTGSRSLTAADTVAGVTNTINITVS